MWNVFASKNRDIAICTVNILFYMPDPKNRGDVSLASSLVVNPKQR